MKLNARRKDFMGLCTYAFGLVEPLEWRWLYVNNRELETKMQFAEGNTNQISNLPRSHICSLR